MSSQPNYQQATRHPWPCWLFVLPLLVAYESGVLLLGGEHPEVLRNGADHWLRRGLFMVGLQAFWVPPALLAIVFAIWIWRRRYDPSCDLLGTLSGMVLESVAYAIGLWALSRALAPLLDQFTVATSVSAGPIQGLRQILPYIGAGIYEEALFRLGLYTVLAGLFLFLEAPRWLAVFAAAVISAILFSAAHHLGPYGQKYSHPVFLFRVIAGLYFAVLFEYRGFGITVGAHACYNVMVSVGVP